MKYVNNLLQYRVPLVFISATLPIPLLRLIEQEFLLLKGVNRVIRLSTIRDNIEYRVVNTDGNLKIADIEGILEIFKS